MNHVVISYTIEDSRHAVELANRLRSAGVEVWIHEGGIDAATQWTQEIVGAIEQCSAFIILLSQAAVNSKNVQSELSIASENEREILPVEIEQITLPSSFRYQLAGIQRASLSDFGAIMNALRRMGIANTFSDPVHLAAADASRKDVQTQTADTRKSLIVLPFEDLSPTGEDNAWFADGLVGELIDMLSHVKSLRLIDRKTAMDLRNFRGKTKQIADLLDVRYFIEGTVRKFGPEIKISVQLLDIETGEYLWQESHRGEFKDIFDLQEAVSKQVVDGLSLTLTREEKTSLETRGTKNADAYELFLKAEESGGNQTQDGYRTAERLTAAAIALDPNFADAYRLRASSLAGLYRNYDRNPEYLVEGEALVRESLRLKPEAVASYSPLSKIYLLQGKKHEAEETAKEFVRQAPDDFYSHFTLGFFYHNIGDYTNAIPSYEQAARLHPDGLELLINLVTTCSAVNEEAKAVYWALEAIPRIERHLKLHPDHDAMRSARATLLAVAGRIDEARSEAIKFKNVDDAASLYDTAGLFFRIGDFEESLATFRRAIERGLSNVGLLRTGLGRLETKLGGTPGFEEVKNMIDLLELEQRLPVSGA